MLQMKRSRMKETCLENFNMSKGNIVTVCEYLYKHSTIDEKIKIILNFCC